MSDKEIGDSEGELLYFIDNISRLEWRKYQSRYPRMWDGREMRRVDHSGHPPFLSFRFEREDSALIEKIRAAVESYRGRVKWGLYYHRREGLPGVNWMICPQFMEEKSEVALSSGLSASQYMANFHPEFGPVAYDDLDGLQKHVRSHFLPKEGN